MIDNTVKAFQNTYTLKNYKREPKYMKLVRWVDKHRNEEFDKSRLFFESGYCEQNKFGNDYFKIFRGQHSSTLKALHYYGVIEYNTSTKKWHVGPNLDKYLSD